MIDRIAVDPHIHFGKPCVAGTRITVENILELVREGAPFPEIVRDHYPDLQAKNIRACVQFAIDVAAAEDVHFAAAYSASPPGITPVSTAARKSTGLVFQVV